MNTVQQAAAAQSPKVVTTKTFRSSREKPFAVTASILASWNIRVSASLWKRVKYEEPTQETAIELLNAIAMKIPKKWMIQRITKEGKILVCRRPLETFSMPKKKTES